LKEDHVSESLFGSRVTVEQVEEGQELAPKFDAAGLIPCVTTDFHSGEVLMVAVMNREALARTIETGEAHYWSRSRRQLWHKGATSGLVQKVVEMRIDDDQDCVWLRVEIAGGASCHVGYRSCFYRKVPVGAARAPDSRCGRGGHTLVERSPTPLPPGPDESGQRYSYARTAVASGLLHDGHTGVARRSAFTGARSPPASLPGHPSPRSPAAP